jgi:dipeptidyl aminopeptidase/acylaminoacyl peptidase
MKLRPALFLSTAACMISALAITTVAGVDSATAQSNAASANATDTSRIPVAEFVKFQNMRDLSISPDGKRLAYLAGVGGRSVLVMLDLETYKEKRILSSEESRERGDQQLTSFRWVGNEHLLLTVILRENLGGGDGNFRRLLAYDVNDGKLIQQAWKDTGGDGGAIRYIDHEEGTFLLEKVNTADMTSRKGYPEIVRVDVRTGKEKRVQRANPVIRGWAVDSTGEIRAGFNSNRDNGKFRMLFKPEGERNLKTVYNEADATFTESLPTPDMFIAGTNYAYTVSNHEGIDKVYKIDMTTLEMVETVFETEGFDVQGLRTRDNGGRLLGFSTFDGTRGIEWVDPEMKEIQSALDANFGENMSSIVDYSDDLSTMIVEIGGSAQNPGYFLWNRTSGDFQLLSWGRAGLKDAPLNPVKAEWYTASDGKKIQAIVTYPRHRIGEKNLPVVVMPHGGPFGVLSATNSGEPWNQPLAEMGYVVVQPNYRGSGGYGKDFVAVGREPGGYGKRMQDDLNDVLTYFGAQGIIDPSRACIMGWSYGGYAAARGAQRDPNVWKCAIAGAGVYDMPLMNRWDAKNLGRFSEGFQATSEDPDGISPASNTDGKWSPILIVTAKRDARIPMEQAETLVRNLKRSGKVEGTDFKYIVQEQGTHNLPYDDVHIQWIEEAHAWLEKYNPAYIATDEGKAPPMMEM